MQSNMSPYQSVFCLQLCYYSIDDSRHVTNLFSHTLSSGKYSVLESTYVRCTRVFFTSQVYREVSPLIWIVPSKIHIPIQKKEEAVEPEAIVNLVNTQATITVWNKIKANNLEKNKKQKRENKISKQVGFNNSISSISFRSDTQRHQSTTSAEKINWQPHGASNRCLLLESHRKNTSMKGSKLPPTEKYLVRTQ